MLVYKNILKSRHIYIRSKKIDWEKS